MKSFLNLLHFNFLTWGSKSVQIFHFVLNLIWGCSKWVQIALFASWNNSDLQCLFLIGCLIFRIFYNHCSICVLEVVGVALQRFWTQIEDNCLLNLCSGPKMSSSCNIQDANRANSKAFWAASNGDQNKMENFNTFWA